MAKKAAKKAVTKKAATKKAKKPTRIFSHKGQVGIEGGDEYVNDPDDPMNMGCVVLVKNIEITQEAYDILKELPKSGGSLATIMCWDSSEGPCFGWMGGKLFIMPEDADGDREYTPSFLEKRIKKITIPKEFKQAVES